MINRISFKTIENQIKSAATPVKWNNTLERVPEKDTVSFKGKGVEKRAAKIPSEVRKMLDNMVFEFEKYEGGIYKGTVRDYLKNSIILKKTTKDIPPSIVHCTGTKDTAKKIVSEGLDWTKTSRMYCGPGTYFSPSYGAGEFYGAGSVPVYAKYKGKNKKYPIFEPRFYSALTKNKELGKKIEEMSKRKPLIRY